MSQLFTPAQYAAIAQLIRTSGQGGSLDSSAFLLAEKAFGQSVSNERTAKDLQMTLDGAAQRLQDAVNSIEENIIPYRVPIGCVAMFLQTALPSGWLELDGRTFKAEEYPQLAQLLGDTNLPDFKGRVPRGYGYSRFALRNTENGAEWYEYDVRKINDYESDATQAHTHGQVRNVQEFGGSLANINEPPQNPNARGYVTDTISGGINPVDQLSQRLVLNRGGRSKIVYPMEERPVYTGDNQFDGDQMPFGWAERDPDLMSFENRMKNHSVCFAIFAGIPELLTEWVDVPEDEEGVPETETEGASG